MAGLTGTTLNQWQKAGLADKFGLQLDYARLEGGQMTCACAVGHGEIGIQDNLVVRRILVWLPILDEGGRSLARQRGK